MENIITDISIPWDNNGATDQDGEVTPGAGTSLGGTCGSQDGWCSFEVDIQNSLWFTFTVPSLTRLSIGAGDANDPDTQLALYTAVDCADFGTFEEVAANDDLFCFYAVH